MNHTVIATCEKCHQRANIVHDFFTCDEIQAFWNEVYDMVNNICKYPLANLTINNILFGLYNGTIYDTVNHVIIYAKYFIHKQKIQKNKLYFKHFISFYKIILNTEKERYTMLDNLPTFHKRFDILLENI